MSHFNKNVSSLLLLALFINVTTLSMNAKAAKIYIYNLVSPANSNVTAICGTEVGDNMPYEIPYSHAYDIISDTLSVACSFTWQGGALSWHLVYDVKHDTCTTCVWILKPKPAGFCFQKPEGEVCSSYDG